MNQDHTGEGYYSEPVERIYPARRLGAYIVHIYISFFACLPGRFDLSDLLELA